MPMSPISGGRKIQRLLLLKYYNELKQETRFTLSSTPEADRLNKSNQEIGEMRAPNISRDNGLFL